MLSRPLSFVAVSLLIGCGGDPNGGNARGTLTVADPSTAGTWLTLELRACPADAGVSAPACEGRTDAPLSRLSLPADGGTQVAYTMKVAPGFTTPVRDWRIVAWLETRADAGDVPASGQRWGTAVVTLPPWSGGYYAGLGTADVTLDQTVP
ncbi:MAG: hypothetical protein IPJ65_01825 [Archangiaceae bacterium]|nr:hypothetical protein [Archangiaceae bacterium]